MTINLSGRIGSLAYILITIASLACATHYAAQVTTGRTVHINFEKFPGPDGILGTADDIATAPGDAISTQYSSVGASFLLTDGGYAIALHVCNEP